MKYNAMRAFDCVEHVFSNFLPSAESFDSGNIMSKRPKGLFSILIVQGQKTKDSCKSIIVLCGMSYILLENVIETHSLLR